MHLAHCSPAWGGVAGGAPPHCYQLSSAREVVRTRVCALVCVCVCVFVVCVGGVSQMKDISTSSRGTCGSASVSFERIG